MEFKIFFRMYFFCGIIYFLYTFYKIFERKEVFLILLREQFGEDIKIEYIVGFFMLYFITLWPFTLMNEIKNKKDLE